MVANIRFVIERLVNVLETFTRDATKLRHPEVERLVELAAVATAHAVALEALRAERADSLWHDAHIRAEEPIPLEVELERRLARPDRLAA